MSTEEASVGSTAPFHKHPSSVSRPSSATPSIMGYSSKPWITQGNTKTGGQIFLCAIGGMISASIGLWLAVFSDDVQWRRFLFASLALVCALLFVLLGFTTARHVTHTHVRHPSHPPRLRRQTTTSSSRTVNGSGCKRPAESCGMVDHADEHGDGPHGHQEKNNNHDHHRHSHHHAHFDDIPDRPKVDV